MIDQGVTAALAARDANRNGDDNHTSGTGEEALALAVNQPQELGRVHNHVCMKCYTKTIIVPIDGLHIGAKLQIVEEPVEIMNREVKRLKQSRFPIVKV
ncbi:hypothetical protein Tco_0266149 [Tanacetum coccineum]